MLAGLKNTLVVVEVASEQSKDERHKTNVHLSVCICTLNACAIENAGDLLQVSHQINGVQPFLGFVYPRPEGLYVCMHVCMHKSLYRTLSDDIDETESAQVSAKPGTSVWIGRSLP